MPPRAPPAPGPRAAAAEDAGGADRPAPRPLALRPWKWLLLLALPAACSAPPPRPVYTNHWAVQVLGGPAQADRVAQAHGYLNLGQVSAAGPAPQTFRGPRWTQPGPGTRRGVARERGAREAGGVTLGGHLPGAARGGAVGRSDLPAGAVLRAHRALRA